MVIIAKSSYHDNDSVSEKKPLMIGCSGGGGHIAAIQGVRLYLENKFKNNINIPDHNPISFKEKSLSSLRDQIAAGINVMYARVIGRPIRAVISLSNIPILPNKESLEKEMASLSTNNSIQRKYIDMLLDVYPAGYESAAIWNVLQRDEKTKELKKLIQLQHISEEANYHAVYDYYLDLLKSAAQKHEPFTEIISTQAMALTALCDVVKAYNSWGASQEIKPPAICIHQYMTDLPTRGAVHFFNPLSTLNTEQQYQMKLYGVGIEREIIHHFFPGGQNFSGIFDIPATANPMVREGFKNPELDNSESFEKEVTLNLSDGESYIIKPDEQIASIMLGSQASNDSYEYIERLLKNGMDKVFVFGGKTNPKLQEKIKDLLERNPEYKGCILPLSNQSDEHIAPLMTRSNVLVIRGGGLSVMEQLAMRHNPQQSVLIHHANSPQKILSSGISWEDENVDALIKSLKSKGVHSVKTSPERAYRDLGEARLITVVKKYEKAMDPKDALQYIQSLSDDSLNLVLKELTVSEKLSTPALPEKLIHYFYECEKEAEAYVRRIDDKLTEIIEHISSTMNDKCSNSRFADNCYPGLGAVVQAKKEFVELKAILSINPEENNSSANQRLIQFKGKYEGCIDKISLPNNNVMKRLLKKIYYILANYFSYFEGKLTPEQEIKKIVSQRYETQDKFLFFQSNYSGKAQKEEENTIKPEKGSTLKSGLRQ